MIVKANSRFGDSPVMTRFHIISKLIISLVKRFV